MALRLDGVAYSYGTGIDVFEDLVLDIPAGECVLITGRNGAGKSTLLKLLNGILKPTRGQVIIDGIKTTSSPTSFLARSICVTFQNPSHQLFASTVHREVEFAPRNLRREDSRQLVTDSLQLFGLQEYAGVHPYDLSLAHRKLLALASAVASDAGILAFDEPSVNLSLPERNILVDAVVDLRKKGKTLLVVSHDVELFFPLCTKLLVLEKGKVLSFGPPGEVDQSILRRSGVRLPVVQRLRPYFGLPLFTSSSS